MIFTIYPDKMLDALAGIKYITLSCVEESCEEQDLCRQTGLQSVLQPFTQNPYL